MPDPVKAGLVVSLNRPGGNMTGIAASPPSWTRSGWKFCASWCLRRPNRRARQPEPSGCQGPVAGRAGSGASPRAASERIQRRQRARHRCGLRGSGRQRITALLIVADPFFTSRHAQLAELTARHRVPAIYATRDFAEFRWPGELRKQHPGRISSGRNLRRPRFSRAPSPPICQSSSRPISSW